MATSEGKLKNLTAWGQQFHKENVQSEDIYANANDFLSSETVVLATGPAKFSELKGQLVTLIPIGLVQNAQVSQQKQLQQLFEVGSRKPFFVPGRTIISCSMSRILFDGPSLMYSMYMKGKASGVSPDGTEITLSDTSITNNPDWSNALGGDKIDDPTSPVTTGSFNDPQLKTTTTGADPGYFFINLASSFFNRATGLAFIIYDNERQPYGGFYLENCYVSQHSFGVASNQTILMENILIRCSTLIPLAPSEFGGI